MSAGERLSAVRKHLEPTLKCSDLTARTLQAERAKGLFPVGELTHVLTGGPSQTARRERAMAEFGSDPEFGVLSMVDWGRGESRRKVFSKVRRTLRLFMRDQHDSRQREARLETFALSDPAWLTRMGVSYGLFVGALRSQGSAAQQAEWVPRALMCDIYGCFAMTELGHGSFTRGTETTATFTPPETPHPTHTGPSKYSKTTEGPSNPREEESDAENPDFEDEYTNIPPTSPCFTLHTPSLTATKWWIGAAAHTATHATVYARLVDGSGVDRGVHCFLVELRDRETGKLHDGIVIGDCGPKLGREGIDNGFIQFHHHKIPLSALLCRHVCISRDGVFGKAPHDTEEDTDEAGGDREGGKVEGASSPTSSSPSPSPSRPPSSSPASSSSVLKYGALVLGRATMVRDSADALKLSTTIALRYAAMRRQGVPSWREDPLRPHSRAPLVVGDWSAAPPSPSAPRPGYAWLEPQVLEYATTQRRLLSLLATAFGFHFSAEAMRGAERALQHSIDSGPGPELSRLLSILPSLHATSAGLKAFTTWEALRGIEVCRQSLGGHGFSSLNRLARLGRDFAVQCTWEGDNTVMALQTARYVMTAMRNARRKGGEGGGGGGEGGEKKEVVGGLGWVERVGKGVEELKCAAQSPQVFASLDVLEELGKAGAAAAAIQGAKALDRAHEEQGLGKDAWWKGDGAEFDASAWASASPVLLEASRAHTWAHMGSVFADAVRKLAEGKTSDAMPWIPKDSDTRACLYTPLLHLARLFLLLLAAQNEAALLREALLSPQQAEWIEPAQEAACKYLRSQCIALCDAFAFSDALIAAPLASSSGHIYPAYMSAVLKTKGALHTSPSPYWHTLIKPMLNGEDLDTENPADIQDQRDDPTHEAEASGGGAGRM